MFVFISCTSLKSSLIKWNWFFFIIKDTNQYVLYKQSIEALKKNKIKVSNKYCTHFLKTLFNQVLTKFDRYCVWLPFVQCHTRKLYLVAA